MSRAIHVFRSPDRFVAGTVGQPGNRTFYLQAVHEARVVSVVRYTATRPFVLRVNDTGGDLSDVLPPKEKPSSDAVVGGSTGN